MSSSSSWVDTRSFISCFTSEVVRICGAAGAMLLVSSSFSSGCSEASGEGDRSRSGDPRAVGECVDWVSAIELGC